MKLYANFEIGIPKQNIEIPLDFDSNDFYISDIHFKYSDSNNKLYTDINFYNSSKSISLFSLDDVYLDGNNFFLGEYSKEIFYFNETKINLEFYLPIKLKRVESGGIGLLLNTPVFNSERSFLKVLKNKYLIENYYWSILNIEDYIFLFVGKLPHELNNKLSKYNNNLDYNIDNMKIINAEIQNGIMKNIINIDKTIIYQNKKVSNFDDIKKIELNYHSGGIEVPIILLSIYEKVFSQYIFEKKCFKEELHIPKNIFFFYCINNNIIVNEIKQTFPNIEFYNNNINSSFNLEFNDLFCIKDNYTYFLMFFDNSYKKHNDTIVMGKPFIKKYKFSFDPYNKLIFFYTNIDNKNESSKLNKKENRLKVKIIIVIICIFIFISIFFFLFMKFYLNRYINRAKKTYELDDEYEYIPKNNKAYIINND